MPSFVQLLGLAMVLSVCAKAEQTRDAGNPPSDEQKRERAEALLMLLLSSHRWLHKQTDDDAERVRVLYAEAAAMIADKGLDSGVRSRLASELRALVSAARATAHARGVQDFTNEVGVLASQFDAQLDGGPAPVDDEVQRAIDDAVDVPIEMARDAIDAGKDPAEVVLGSAWRGVRVSMSETVRAYNEARTAALHDLQSKHPDKYGIVLADDEDDRKAAEAAGLLALQLRWSAVLDERTCPKCKARHGELRFISDPFSDGPPLHAHCRCIVTLWPFM